MKALSIVAPNGSKIVDGIKTIEVRSWKPTIELDEEFLIVENQNYLKNEGDEDENGLAVATARIKRVREFVEDDIESACASYWAKGYYSWELYDVRKINGPYQVIAKRRFYEIEL